MAVQQSSCGDSTRHCKQQASRRLTFDAVTDMQLGTTKRKLRSSACTNPATACDRFLRALQKNSSRCCYGAEATRQALEFYSVDELLVSAHGSPGGLSTEEWTSLALKHRAVLVHVVYQETSAGKRFCAGFGVGAILGRCLKDDPEEFNYDAYTDVRQREPIAQEDSLSTVDLVSMNLPPVSRSDQHAIMPNSLPNLSRADASFFAWLASALMEQFQDDSSWAMALLDGAYVILTGSGSNNDKNSLQEIEERLDNAESILQHCAPSCAANLRAQWYAVHFADFEAA